jgi:hypothetical protein
MHGHEGAHSAALSRRHAAASVRAVARSGPCAGAAPSAAPVGYFATAPAFVSGCGGGQRCECSFDSLERAIEPERFMAASQEYMRSGQLPDDVMTVILQSSC